MIKVIGTIFGIQGYDAHTRGLANALDKQHPVKLDVNLPANWPMFASDRELQMIRREGKAQTNLIITLPIS